MATPKARHTPNYLKNSRARLNKVVSSNTAFKTFDALLSASAYRPSIRVDSFVGAAWLADCYDSAQIHRGDSRRAFRTVSV